jgi:hypothetical protein
MARALTRGLAVCLLGLAACLRFGYPERPNHAADGVDASLPDAAAPRDASVPPDASMPSDAATPPDAATKPDASAMPDAAAMPDASTMPDASVTPDAAAGSDAAGEPDAAPAPDAAIGCTPSAARDYCMRLPALAQPPQLDGVLDCGPSLIDLPASGWTASQALPSDNHARYAAAWRPDGLYFYVEVDDTLRLPALAKDVDPWCGDGVELYADADGKYYSAPDYDDPGTIQLLAAAPARDPSTPLAVDARYHTRSELRSGDWTTTRHVMVPRAGGYALEAFVAAADLELSSWGLASGNTVGIDIAINVSVPDENQKVGCGYYLGQYYLRVSRAPCTTDACRPYSNVAAFCTPLLE